MKRTLESYINIRRWNSELNFFDTELAFFKRLARDLEKLLPGLDVILHQQTALKISGLITDKNKVLQLLNSQLTDLELLAEGLLTENKEEMAAKQAQLEYQVHHLVHELREIKTVFFSTVEQVLNKQKLVVN